MGRIVTSKGEKEKRRGEGMTKENKGEKEKRREEGITKEKEGEGGYNDWQWGQEDHDKHERG